MLIGFSDYDYDLLSRAKVVVHPASTGRRVRFGIKIGDQLSGPITRGGSRSLSVIRIAIMEAANHVISPERVIGRIVFKRDFLPRYLDEAYHAWAVYMDGLKKIESEVTG